MEKEFSCVRDGLTIRGTEYGKSAEDAGNAQYPAAIMCHGFSGCQYDLMFYVNEFVKLGYLVYCFDFCGGCRVGKSDGDNLDMTIDTEVLDLKKVLDYVESLSYIDKSHIILIGASQGGYVAGITAADRSEEIERLILFYPALCIPDAARTGTLGGANYDINNVPDVINTFGIPISRKFHDSVVDKDPIAQISGYKGPVLLIHGSEDKIVNEPYARQAGNGYENCHLQILEGAGHGFSEKQRREVIVSIKEFLKGHKEILTIRVHITGYEENKNGEEKTCYVYFDGECKNEYFNGKILPGAVDEQHYLNGNLISMCATYELSGQDCDGNDCFIKIVNKSVGGEFKPLIKTDSPKLKFLNENDLTAALEGFDGGLTVRVFA